MKFNFGVIKMFNCNSKVINNSYYFAFYYYYIAFCSIYYYYPRPDCFTVLSVTNVAKTDKITTYITLDRFEFRITRVRDFITENTDN